MSKQDPEFERVPWALQMGALAEALRERGRDVPAGYTVTLVSVPEAERDARGLPLFRAVRIPIVGTVNSRTGEVTFTAEAAP